MILINNQHYTLPDSTRVVAVYMSSGSWRFADVNGWPLLIYTDQCELKRLEYHEDQDAFRLVECDLDLEDPIAVE